MKRGNKLMYDTVAQCGALKILKGEKVGKLYVKGCLN